jgi:hypothetical protein
VVIDSANTRSALNTVLSSINNMFQHMCLDEAFRMLNTHSIRQSTDYRVAGHTYVIPGLAGTEVQAPQIWAVWFIVKRLVWDADIPGAEVADEMGFGKTFTSVAAAMICKLLTENSVMGLPLFIFWGKTQSEWEIFAHNDLPGIASEAWERYPHQRLCSVPCHLLEIQ